MNSVPIDEDQVTAELDQLAGGAANSSAGPEVVAEVPGVDPGGERPAALPMDWTIAAGGMVLVLDKVIAPNWKLQDEEKALLHEQLKVTLGLFFPDTNLDPRVQSLMVLGGTVAMIAAARFDPATKRLKPLRVRPAEGEGGADAGKDSTPA